MIFPKVKLRNGWLQAISYIIYVKREIKVKSHSLTFEKKLRLKLRKKTRGSLRLNFFNYLCRRFNKFIRICWFILLSMLNFWSRIQNRSLLNNNDIMLKWNIKPLHCLCTHLKFPIFYVLIVSNALIIKNIT